MAGVPRTAMAIIAFFTVFNGEVYGTLESEITSESVELKFYLITSSSWNSAGHTSTFQTNVASYVSSYCAQNLATCGLNSAATFNSSDVGIVSGYPEDDSKDMNLKFYVLFPSGASVSSSSSTSFVLPSAAVSAISLNNRNDIQSIAGTYITYIGTDFYGIPPATLANSVIIPIGFAVLIVLIIITVVLYYRQQNSEKQTRKKKLLKMRQESKVTPNNTDVEKGAKKASSMERIRRPKTRPGPKPEIENSNKVQPPYLENGSHMTFDMKTGATHVQPQHTEVSRHVSLNEFQVDDGNHTTVLPPLPPAYDDLDRRQERRRRKKRSKKRRREEEGHDNTAMDTSEGDNPPSFSVNGRKLDSTAETMLDDSTEM